jgi:hypothetical protein
MGKNRTKPEKFVANDAICFVVVKVVFLFVFLCNSLGSLAKGLCLFVFTRTYPMRMTKIYENGEND